MTIKGQAGFTLLEVLIAMAIMLLAVTSIVLVESGSIQGAIKAKQINIVSMLAKKEMVETEYAFEGKTFDEFKKEESGTFPEPYTEYSWKRVVKEIKFPNMAPPGGGGGGGGGGGEGGDKGQSNAIDTMMRLVTKFLSDSIREVTVTISFKRGNGVQNYSVSTYWVDLNRDFALSE